MSYSASSVQDAWNNHLAAFGSKDVEKVLLDYDDNSMITNYNHTTAEKNVFKGLEGVRTFFTQVFEKLSSTGDLVVPVSDLDEEGKMIFVIWASPSSGITDATDTFIFDEKNKIRRQNVVFRTV